MSYVPITPFGRPVSAALIKHQKYATAALPPEGVNKYEVIRELTVARRALAISDREIALLQTLLSFYPNTILGGNSDELLVYPSNAAICERQNGMPCSTMRRHLAGLVNAGLILRRDSPNGKRFNRRHGDAPQAFGFDLTPLVARYSEICVLAEDARAQEEKFQRLRRNVSLMRRDLAGLAAYGMETRPDLALWDAFSDLAALTARDLRRTLSYDDLLKLETDLSCALDRARTLFDVGVTEIPSTNDVHIEQHHQNSNKDSYVSEKNIEKIKRESSDQKLPNIPLTLVTSVCQEFKTYAPQEVRHWHHLVQAADVIRPMMGISPSAWFDATDAMGHEEAAVVLCAMLERFEEIKSPGGYLRALTRKASEDGFSVGPMIMALMTKRAA